MSCFRRRHDITAAIYYAIIAIILRCQLMPPLKIFSPLRYVTAAC